MPKSILKIILITFTFISLNAVATGKDLACTMVMCLYDEIHGESTDSCIPILGEYKKIVHKSKKGRVLCPLTIEKRRATLMICEENIYPLDELLNCKT